MKRMRSKVGLVVSAVVALCASSASADEAADTATARALGIEGVTLAEAGRCKEAIERLDRAEKLHHAPTTATRLAECEIETGKLVVGTERLQRVIREPLAANAHPAFVAAVGRAQTLLEATLPRLATLRISVSAPSTAKLSILIDGEATSDATLDTNRRIDPGTHQIQVSAPEFFPATLATSIGEGETRSVVLELRPDPKAVAADDASDKEAPARGRPMSRVPAFVAFGVAAAGLGVGIYATTRVDDRTAELGGRCSMNHVCPTDLKPTLDEAKTWAAVSTAGFITAGAGAALGALFLYLSGSSTPSSPKSRAEVRPTIGLTSLGVDGVF
jgi:hypothetical protein